MIVYKCNKCKKEKKLKQLIEIKINYDYYDLCEDCIKELEKYIKGDE